MYYSFWDFYNQNNFFSFNIGGKFTILYFLNFHAFVFNHKIKEWNFKKNSVLFFPISNIRLDLHLIPNCGSCDDDELLDVIITSSSSEESLSAGANPKLWKLTFLLLEFNFIIVLHDGSVLKNRLALISSSGALLITFLYA